MTANPTFLNAFERSVRDERERQDAKWGEQNHPDGTGGPRAEEVREAARAQCQDAALRGEQQWSLILAEEVFEAIAEEDQGALYEELIQVAAVAQAWAEAIARRIVNPTCVETR
jgi:hypothetical protein